MARFYLNSNFTDAFGFQNRAEQSTALPGSGTLKDNFTSSVAGYGELQLTVPTQVGLQTTCLAQTALQSDAHYRFFPRALPFQAQTVAAANWTVAIRGSVSNANLTGKIALSIYAWNTSTNSRTGFFYDSATGLGSNLTTTLTNQVYTVSGNSLAVTANDILVVEVWFVATNAMATSYTITAPECGANSYVDTPAAVSFQAPPTITSVSPNTGSTGGGTSVTISGSDMTGVSSVSFGGTSAASFTAVNATTVTAVTPSMPVGVVDVYLTNSYGLGTATNAYTFAVPTSTTAVRAQSVVATTSTTWSNTSNVLDGTVAVDNDTAATWVSATSGAVATIDLGFYTAFSSIPTGSTINQVKITYRQSLSSLAQYTSISISTWQGSFGSQVTTVGSTSLSAGLLTEFKNMGTFGGLPTLAQLKNNFGVRFTITHANNTTSGTYSLTFVDVEVTYTPPPPAITSISPNAIVPAATGTGATITVNGSGFTGMSSYNFAAGGGFTNFTVVNDAQFTFPSPGVNQGYTTGNSYHIQAVHSTYGESTETSADLLIYADSINNYTQTYNDNGGRTDTATAVGAQNYTNTQDDVRGLVDTAVYAHGWVRPATPDNCGLTDGFTTQLIKDVTANDKVNPVSSVDSITSVRVLAFADDDETGKIDAVVLTGIYNRTHSDDRSLTDDLALTHGLVRPTTPDSTGLVDVRTTELVKTSVQNDDRKLTDNAQNVQAFGSTVDDDTGLADSDVQVFAQAVTDSRGLDDTTATESVYIRTVADNRGTTDSAQGSLAFTLTFTESTFQVDDASPVHSALAILPPDSILASSGLTGVVASLQDDPATPDANWVTGSSGPVSLRVGFPSPGGGLVVDSLAQNFRVLARSTRGPGTVAVQPDAIFDQLNITGVLASVQDDPDAGSDSTWWVATGNNVNTQSWVTFPTPPDPLTDGAGLQEVRVRVRKFSATQTGTPTARIEIVENGVLRFAGGNTSVTSATGQVLSFTFNSVGMIPDDIEVRVIGTATGGSPAVRNTVDVGAIEWIAAYTPAPVQISAYVYESGSMVDTVGSFFVTSTGSTSTGSVETLPWSASALTDSNGESVELYFDAADSVDFGAIAWDAMVIVPTFTAWTSTPPADDLGLSDSVSVVVSRATTLNDATGVVDQSATSTAASRVASDVTGLLDPASAAVGLVRAASDVTGLTDASVSALGLARIATDSTGFVDSASPVIGFARVSNDPVGLVDVSTTAAVFSLSSTDVTGLTDTASAALVYATTAVDVSGLTDTAISSLLLSLAATDARGLADTTSLAVAFSSTTSDITGLVDTAAPATTASRTSDDVTGLLDTATSAAVYAAAVSDATGLVDNQTAAQSFAATASDITGLVDTRTSAVGYATTPTDISGLVDTTSNAGSGSAAFTDTAGLVDTATSAVARATTNADSTGLIDLSTLAAAYAATASDVTGLVDNQTPAQSFATSSTDTTGLADVSSSAVGYAATRSDITGLTDVSTSASAFTTTLTDLVGLVDTALSVVARTTTVTDFLGAVDALSSVLGFGTQTTDTCGLADSMPSRLAPDGIALQTNLTGVLTDIQDDPASPDANWMMGSGPVDLRVTFSTPVRPLDGLQVLRVLVRP